MNEQISTTDVQIKQLHRFKKLKVSLSCFLSVLMIITMFPVSAMKTEAVSVSKITYPKYSGKSYVVVNKNKPQFSKSQITTKAFEKYSKLDKYGRCGTAFANICKKIMPTTKRGEIGMVKPTGWHTVKYSGIDGKYLYNRCHLIGYQLAGENANKRNLITGTRYLNIEGMLPFENMVTDYVKETNNHVLYRVTPVFQGKNLVASGVKMEGYSVEDKGKGICFNVYCYNVQPGIKINYANGESSGKGKSYSKTENNSSSGTKKKTNDVGITLNKRAITLYAGKSYKLSAKYYPSKKTSRPKFTSSNTKVATVTSSGKVIARSAGKAVITAKSTKGFKARCTVTVKGTINNSANQQVKTFVLNTNSKKYHLPGCSGANRISKANKKEVRDTKSHLISLGYEPCKICCP